MIDGYEKHTCTECETMFTSNEELHQHHIIDHGVALTESTVEWNDISPEDQVEETDGEFTSNGKPVTFSDEDEKLAREYLSETAELQKVQIASEQRLKMARDQIKAIEQDTDEFYEQILGESNGQDFSSGAGTINPLDTPKFKYSKNNKLADTIHTKGYNPNPNAGLYNNKEFKEGDSHLEDPLAKEDFEVSFYGGESKASEGKDRSMVENIWGLLVNSSRMQFLDEYMGDMNIPLMITMGEMSMPETNEEVADAIGVSKSEALKFISRWSYDNGITDQLYNESKASEYDTDMNHGEDAEFSLHSWELVSGEAGNGFQCSICGLVEDDIGDEGDRLESSESKASEFTSDDTLSNIWNNMDDNLKSDVLEYFEDSDEFVGNNVDKDFYSIVRKLGIASDKFKEDVEEFEYLINESKSDESLKADWDESGYEEKYSWLKDLGVDDSYKYANMTLYELPENIWSKVNEDYVKGFKQIMAESYTPDQQNVIETAEEKIISRKLDGTPEGQIARELVLWNDFTEEHATKLVGEVEPSDNDMVAKTLFNKRYSECSESEIQEMELYDA